MNLPAETPHGCCANCGAPLHGHFCGACGQAAHGSARSLATLLHDVWHDLTHLDGRLWRTLLALAVRPGHLTAEYLHDRRARYLPPFRLYLVLSIAFFAVAAARPHGPVRTIVIGTDRAQAEEARRRVDEILRQTRAGAGEGTGAPAETAERDPERACAWLTGAGGQRLGDALVRACRGAMADGGRALGHAFLANVPKTLFLFLPLVGLVLFGLFGRTRRFYVEHLVLALHLQSALFLLATLALIAYAALAWAHAPGALADLTTLAAWGYGTWYAWRSLRVVYAEPRGRTLAKLVALGLVYGLLLVVTLAGTGVWTVLES